MNAFFVSAYADNAMLGKRVDDVGHQPYGLQKAMSEDRFVNIQFEMSLAACNGNRGVVSKDLAAHHRHGFALRWIDLTRHD